MKNFLKNRFRGRALSAFYPTLTRLFILVPMALLHFAKIPLVGNLLYFFLAVLFVFQVVFLVLNMMAVEAAGDADKIDKMLEDNPLSFYQKDRPPSALTDFSYQIPVLLLSVALGYWLLVVLWLLDTIFLAINKVLVDATIRKVENRWTQKNSQ